MDRKQEFSIAAKRSDEQKKLQEDQERLRRVDQLRSEAEREHHRQAMKLRDEKLKIEQERAKREEEAIVQREIQKRVAAREEMHLTMKKAQGLSPKQQEEMIRHNVRASHGAELDRHQEQIRKDMNREIDQEIDRDLKRQKDQERKQEAKPSMERPWKQASRNNENNRPWKRDDNDRGRDR